MVQPRLFPSCVLACAQAAEQASVESVKQNDIDLADSVFPQMFYEKPVLVKPESAESLSPKSVQVGGKCFRSRCLLVTSDA